MKKGVFLEPYQWDYAARIMEKVSQPMAGDNVITSIGREEIKKIAVAFRAVAGSSQSQGGK